MRQAGILAAAGIIGLEQLVTRLDQDHANARFLAEALSQIPRLTVRPEMVKTNIVIFDVTHTEINSNELLGRLRRRGLIASAVSDTIVRLVTHMDVSRSDCEQAVEIIRSVVSG